MEISNKIKPYSFMSLDGFALEAEDRYDPMPGYGRMAEGGYGFREFRESVSCAVITGIHYAALQASDIWPFGDMTCHILTSRSFSPSPGVKTELILVPEDSGEHYIDAADTLRRKADGDIWLAGGGDIISLFLGRGLIDEITVNILPVTLGGGSPLFGDNGQAHDWTLTGHKIYDNGVVQMRYAADRTCPTHRKD